MTTKPTRKSFLQPPIQPSVVASFIEGANADPAPVPVAVDPKAIQKKQITLVFDFQAVSILQQLAALDGCRRPDVIEKVLRLVSDEVEGFALFCRNSDNRTAHHTTNKVFYLPLAIIDLLAKLPASLAKFGIGITSKSCLVRLGLLYAAQVRRLTIE